jgi:hypothetical protein
MTREQNFLLGGAIATIAAFLIGFGWQYTRANDLADRLESNRVDLTFKRLEATLAGATIEAYRGNYEIGRQLASQFFTNLQNDIAQAPDDKRPQLQRISSQRDAVITAASRSDPQTASLLGQLYSTYRVVFGEAPVMPQPGPAPTSPATVTTQ